MALIYGATVARWRLEHDLQGGLDADLERVLERAERDIDALALGDYATDPTTLRKLTPAALTAPQAEALKLAVVHQAEHRRALGEEWHSQGGEHWGEVETPDYTTRGLLRGRLSPLALEALAGHSLLRNWSTVRPTTTT